MIEYDYEEGHTEEDITLGSGYVGLGEYLALLYSEESTDSQSIESDTPKERQARTQSKLRSREDWEQKILLEEQSDALLAPYMGRRNGGYIYSERRMWQLRMERRDTRLNPDLQYPGVKTQYDRLLLEIVAFEYGLTGRDAFIAVRYAENCTQDEIADMLYVAQPMVNRRLQRIRRQMLNVLHTKID